MTVEDNERRTVFLLYAAGAVGVAVAAVATWLLLGWIL